MVPAPDLVDEGPVRLARRIASAERLELVTRIAADPTRRWTELELSQRLGGSVHDLRGHVDVLVHRGLLVREPPCWIRLAGDPVLRDSLAELAAAYRESPATLLRALNEDAIGRVRVAAALRLSEPPRDGP